MTHAVVDEVDVAGTLEQRCRPRFHRGVGGALDVVLERPRGGGDEPAGDVGLARIDVGGVQAGVDPGGERGGGDDARVASAREVHFRRRVPDPARGGGL